MEHGDPERAMLTSHAEGQKWRVNDLYEAIYMYIFEAQVESNTMPFV